MKTSPILLASPLVLLLLAVLVSCDSSSPTAQPQESPASANGPATSVSLAGQTYRAVKIGSQNWMAENLNYKGVGADTVGSCYANSQDSCKKYGRLYRWAEAMGLADSCGTKTCSTQVKSRHQGICPGGWHLPTDAEWDILMDSAVKVNADAFKLRSKSGWNKAMNGTDELGFTLLPAGIRDKGGEAMSSGEYAYFWTTRERATIYANCRFTNVAGGRFVNCSYDKQEGMSVRCIQD